MIIALTERSKSLVSVVSLINPANLLPATS